MVHNRAFFGLLRPLWCIRTEIALFRRIEPTAKRTAAFMLRWKRSDTRR
jgi:hypothetical protein